MTPPIGGARAGIRGLPLDKIPDSAISRWTFDNADTSGGTTTDVWGDNDATINGATTGASGANQTYTTNEAHSFDGVDDYEDTGVKILDGVSNFTVAVWIYPRDLQDFGFVFNENDDSNGTRLYVGNSGDDVTFEIEESGNNISVKYLSLSANQWTHVAGTYDGSNITIYIDGAQEGSTSASLNIVSATTTEFGRQSGNDRNFDGNIDDLRLYNKALSSTEVSDLYNNGAI